MTLSSKTSFFLALFILFFIACQSTNNYSTDPESIAEGEQLFEAQCSSCHNFQRSGIGPALGGVTADTSAKWLREFIKNPSAMVDKVDKRAVRLHKKYRVVSDEFSCLVVEMLSGVPDNRGILDFDINYLTIFISYA